MNEFFLRLNSSKTKIMIVAPQTVKRNILINGTFINGECIRFVDSAKNLGIILDTELAFTTQIKKLVSSCFFTIKKISKIKKYLIEKPVEDTGMYVVFFAT